MRLEISIRYACYHPRFWAAASPGFGTSSRYCASGAEARLRTGLAMVSRGRSMERRKRQNDDNGGQQQQAAMVSEHEVNKWRGRWHVRRWTRYLAVAHLALTPAASRARAPRVEARRWHSYCQQVHRDWPQARSGRSIQPQAAYRLSELQIEVAIICPGLARVCQSARL